MSKREELLSKLDKLYAEKNLEIFLIIWLRHIVA